MNVLHAFGRRPALVLAALTAVAATTMVGVAGISTMHPARAASQNAVLVNRGVVELETGPADDVSVRMAAEIASIIDDGATRRVVPVVGKGPLQNLIDLKFLRGIDLAIIQADALDYARQQRLVPGIEALSYIVKLYNEDFHLLARPDIKDIRDLAGKTVEVDVKGSGTAITSQRLFGLLGVNANFATDNEQVALQKLRSGNIAAVAFVAATPAPLFQGVTADDRLHLLSIPMTQAVTAGYAPTRITATDYPNLVAPAQPVDTIAVGSVLMAADLRGIPERERNLGNFVDTLFTGFQGLLAPGYDAKWRDINIAADVPGWTRNPAAAQWLRDNPQVAAAAPNVAALKALFSRFIDERRQASGGKPMSPADKDALFQQFESWQHGQAH
jgi:uncharacterized protein